MKSRIAYSRFAALLTAIVSVILLVACVLTVQEKPAFFALLVIFLISVVSALFYGAVYIEADTANVIMGSVFKRKRIPMREVVSVELFQPTMGAIRIFGSGGYMGYWGIFREGGIGRYYAFYGKASDCFLVRTKNGDKYVLGCSNPEKMVDYINSQIAK